MSRIWRATVRPSQLVIVNNEHQLVGSAYRWAAINANFATALGASIDRCSVPVARRRGECDGGIELLEGRLDIDRASASSHLARAGSSRPPVLPLTQSECWPPPPRFIYGSSASLTATIRTRERGTCRDRCRAVPTRNPIARSTSRATSPKDDTRHAKVMEGVSERSVGANARAAPAVLGR